MSGLSINAKIFACLQGANCERFVFLSILSTQIVRGSQTDVTFIRITQTTTELV